MVKGIIYVLITTLAIASSCVHDDITKTFVKDNGCVDLIDVKISDHAITATDLTSAQRLFSKNSISLENLRFTKYDDADPLNTATVHYVHITATQYTNGLPILFSDIGFHFRNDAFYVLAGNRYGTTTNNLDTLPFLELSEVRGLFIGAIKDHKLNVGDYKNSCLDVQFGYIDLNAGSGSLAPGNLKKAWYVTPSGKSYPEAIFLDREGTTFYFFDG